MAFIHLAQPDWHPLCARHYIKHRGNSIYTLNQRGNCLHWNENAKNVVRMHGLQRRVVCCRTYPLPCIWYLISLIPGCQLQQAPSLAIESMHIPLNQKVKNITRSYFRIASLHICNSFYILFLAISVASIKCVVLLMFNIFLFLVNFYFDFFYLYFVLCFVISFPPTANMQLQLYIPCLGVALPFWCWRHATSFRHLSIHRPEWCLFLRRCMHI